MPAHSTHNARIYSQESELPMDSRSERHWESALESSEEKIRFILIHEGSMLKLIQKATLVRCFTKL